MRSLPLKSELLNEAHQYDYSHEYFRHAAGETYLENGHNRPDKVKELKAVVRIVFNALTMESVDRALGRSAKSSKADKANQTVPLQEYTASVAVQTVRQTLRVRDNQTNTESSPDRYWTPQPKPANDSDNESDIYSQLDQPQPKQ